MSNQYTPGPWSFHASPAHGYRIRQSASTSNTQWGSGDVAVVFFAGNGRSPEQCKADARLIAASPDLYAATECAMALGIDPDEGRVILERHGFKWDDDTSVHSPTYRADKFVTELCRAAIAKAGGQP